MNRSRAFHSLLAVCMAATDGMVAAQAPAGQARAQVKMERDEFLKTHRWDEATETWVLKAGVEPPQGVTSRAEIKAARDAFLRSNEWNEEKGAWVPMTGEPRDLGKMSRQQLSADTRRFLLTHSWDDESGSWVDKPPARKK